MSKTARSGVGFSGSASSLSRSSNSQNNVRSPMNTSSSVSSQGSRRSSEYKTASDGSNISFNPSTGKALGNSTGVTNGASPNGTSSNVTSVRQTKWNKTLLPKTIKSLGQRAANIATARIIKSRGERAASKFSARRKGSKWNKPDPTKEIRAQTAKKQKENRLNTFTRWRAGIADEERAKAAENAARKAEEAEQAARISKERQEKQEQAERNREERRKKEEQAQRNRLVAEKKQEIITARVAADKKKTFKSFLNEFKILTEAEKSGFMNQLNRRSTENVKKNVLNLIAKKKEQAMKIEAIKARVAADKKKTFKSFLNNLKILSEAEKSGFMNQLNRRSTENVKKNVVNFVKQKEVLGKKRELRDKFTSYLNKFKNLTTAEKSGFIEQLNRRSVKNISNNVLNLLRKRRAEKKGNTGQSSIKPISGVTQAGGSDTKTPRTAAQGAEKFLKNKENIIKQINSLSAIDSLRKLAVKLGFGTSQVAVKKEYLGKDGAKRLKVDLKNFISNPPPGTRINMSAAAQKTPGGTKRKANVMAQKTPVGKKRKMSAVAPKTPRGTTINARADANGLCNSEMNPVNDGHRKKLLKTKGLLKVYISKIAMDKRKLFTKEKRCEVLDYIVRYNLTSGPQSVVRNIDTNTFINMLLIMWLDGVHDKYVVVTFNEWLQSYKDVFPQENYENDNYFKALKNATFVERKTKNKRRDVYISSGGKTFNILGNAISTTIALELAETPGKRAFFAKTFIDNLGFKGQSFNEFSAGWERHFKSMVLLKYESKNLVNTIDNPAEYRLKSVTPNDKMLLAVDQEYSSREERSLSRIIEGSDAVSPLITYGQAFDPGSTMLPFGIVKDIEGLMVLSRRNDGNIQNEKPQFVSDASYYLEDFNITINCNDKPVIKIDFDSGSTTGESSLKLNGIELDLNVSAGEAKKNENAVNKISKYFGDALQYFIASQLTKPSDKVKTRKTVNGGTRKYHFFLGSGDGMALFGYDFVCTQIFDNGPPNMVIDYSGGSSPKAHIINMDNSAFILSKKEARPTRTQLMEVSYMVRANNNGNTAQSKRPKDNGPK